MTISNNMDSQLRSSLCQLPNEVLFEIAKNVFSGFKLEYYKTTIIRRSRDTDPHMLSLIRACRKLRTALIPVLGECTSELVVMKFKSDFVQKPRPDQVHATSINMSPAFLRGIRDLNLVSANTRFPDFNILPNLERIHIRSKPTLSVRFCDLHDPMLSGEGLIHLVKRQLDRDSPNYSGIVFPARWFDPGPKVKESNQVNAHFHKNEQRRALGIHLIAHQAFVVYKSTRSSLGVYCTTEVSARIIKYAKVHQDQNR